MELFGGSKPLYTAERAGLEMQESSKESKKVKQMLLSGAPNLDSPCCLSIRSARAENIAGFDLLTPGCAGVMARRCFPTMGFQIQAAK